VAARATRLNTEDATPGTYEQMANTPRPGLSSAFDDMLAQSKKRFEDLYRSGRQPSLEATSAPAFPKYRTTATKPRSHSAIVSADSPAVRVLNERFDGDWHYEIAEQSRDGDEAIVLGRLTFGRDNAVRTQFGRARISGQAVAAASGSVRFKVGGAGTERDERDAFRRAAEAALMNCVDLI
jgi:hypothetical protein